MLNSLSSRLMYLGNRSIRVSRRLINELAPAYTTRNAANQIDYLKSVLLKDQSPDWTVVKNKILTLHGHLNQKNVDGVLLKCMINYKNFDAALSFSDYLNKSNEFTLGSLNGVLGLYHAISKERKLTDNERDFILGTYKKIYDKHRVLDSATCERLLHALCAINDYEKALKVLADIYASSIPTHSAYSVIIATLFENGKKKKAKELIEESIKNRRPLQNVAYEAWINFIFKNYKDKKTVRKHIDEIPTLMSKNNEVINLEIANTLKKTFMTLGCNVQTSRIRKTTGECMCCKKKLDLLHLSEEEFLMLQKNVKDKLIVGSDLFLKSSPIELKRFMNFIEETAPYDVVIDGLNIAYAVGKSSSAMRLKHLHTVVDFFTNKNKKVLLLSRKHMLKWQNSSMKQIMSKTSSFFTDDLSQDDPYFLTAAILSGSSTDIVSKDLLRGHAFKLQDNQLQQLFRRWQWQHQWMVFSHFQKGTILQPPLPFTPCTQRDAEGWHFPFDNGEDSNKATVNDGTPDLSSWLCIRSSSKIKIKNILN